MSPEQILGQPLDARADVYGLGVLLYQMVTGELPFRAGTTVDVEELHLRGDRPRASELAPVTSAFDAVVRRALEPERSARYQTVRELLANLRRAIATVEDPVVERFETIGVRLEVKIAQDYASPHTNNGLDAMIDDVDQVSGLVRQQLLHQGLALTLDGTNVVLGVLRLPPGPEAARQVRRRTIDQVRCLAEMIANRPAAHPAVAPVLSVHVSAVAARLGADRPEDVAGPLLDVTRWPPMSNVGGVCVSPQALADIEEGSAAG
jgi:serine/threonine-protein kinase